MTAITIPNTFLPSTTISSTAMNQNFTEVADAIEASLALDGTDTMTGVIRMANGSAAAPALTFGTDTNLGIYRKTTDELAFTTAGVLAAHFDAAGKMWIATDLDIADDFDIGGDATIDGGLTVSGVIDLGHASDTTLSRASAGVVAVEGVNLLRAGQNLADVSSAATSFANIKQAASDTATGAIELAIQSEMETGTDVERAVTPGRQQFHPGHPKMWGRVNVSGGTPTLATSYNVTSITDAAAGNLTVTIATDFSSADWCPGVTPEYNGVEVDCLAATRENSIAAGSVGFLNWQTGQSASPSLVDPDSWSFWGFGDQA
jgi:hypothetical protein